MIPRLEAEIKQRGGEANYLNSVKNIQQVTAEYSPTLNEATIKRSREGLAIAKNTLVRKCIQEALKYTDAIAQGSAPHKVSGEVRRLILRLLIHSFFRVQVEYRSPLPTRPVLLAPNHLNHLDPFLILSEIPAHPYYHILGDARTLFNKWWKRKLLESFQGVIPLERQWKEELVIITAAKAGRIELAELAKEIEQNVPTENSIPTLRRIDRCVQAIFASGDGILIFPEGALGTVPGNLRPLKRGAAIYALRGGVPIVPVAIIGTENLYLGKELILRFGQPLHFPRTKRPKPQQIQKVLNSLERSLLEMLPTNYQEPPGLKLFCYFLNHMFC